MYLSTSHLSFLLLLFFFFFNDPATTEIYTLSLHDALPISARRARAQRGACRRRRPRARRAGDVDQLVGRRLHRPPDAAGLCRDRKSTRLNSSHQIISYAVFCLKKKKKKKKTNR